MPGRRAGRVAAAALVLGAAVAGTVGMLGWRMPGRVFRAVEWWAVRQPASRCPDLPQGRPAPVMIAHAGGSVDGRTYTNSLEALDLHYSRGCRLFEVDFDWTSDGALVLLHDWNANAARIFGGAFAGRWHGRDETLAAPRLDGLTTLDDDGLARWSAAHPDARIVTDIKWDNLKALARLRGVVPGAVDRLVVQIYGFEEFEPVAALGFTSIVLTLYRTDAGDDQVVAFCRGHRLDAVAMSADRALAGLAGRLAAERVPVWVHTVNSPIHLRALSDCGVTGFYSDHLCDCGWSSGTKAAP